MLPKYDGRDLTMSGRVAGLRRSSSRKVVKVLYIFFQLNGNVGSGVTVRVYRRYPLSSKKIYFFSSSHQSGKNLEGGREKWPEGLPYIYFLDGLG